MSKKLLYLGVMLMLFGLLSGCGKSVEGYIKSVYSDTMECKINPDYEGEEMETAEPEPDFSEIIIDKKADITYGVTVVSVKKDKVVFKYDTEWVSARVYKLEENGLSSFLREGKNGTITLNKGEELVITEICLLDASHSVYVRLK